MDIRELRIGNSVLVNGVRAKVIDLHRDILNWKESPYRIFVEGISPETGELMQVGAFVASDSVQPIPLTEELLKELGFENGWQAIFDGYEITVTEQCEFGYSMGKYNVSIKNTMTSSHIATIDGIKHLHELEQFIFLTTKQELI